MSLDRYALMGTASSLEVEAVPRRPLIAPGTKALTKEQLAERRAARDAQAQHAEQQRLLAEGLTQRGWSQQAGSYSWCHPTGASLANMVAVDVEAVLRMADEVVERRRLELAPPIDLRAELASRGWRECQLGFVIRHEPTGAVLTRLELDSWPADHVLKLADARIAALLQQQAQVMPSERMLQGVQFEGTWVPPPQRPHQAIWSQHPGQAVWSNQSYALYPGRGG